MEILFNNPAIYDHRSNKKSLNGIWSTNVEDMFPIWLKLSCG